MGSRNIIFNNMRVALISAGLVCLASANNSFMNINALFEQEVFGAQNATY
jgi:hypothetical protein